MQAYASTSATPITTSSVGYASKPFAVTSKPVITAAPPSLNQPTLNLPSSAKYQPANATTPSYSPYQTPEVEETRANQRQVQREQAASALVLQKHQQVQIADRRLASNVLTGEYNAAGAQSVPAPRVGGYLLEVA